MWWVTSRYITPLTNRKSMTQTIKLFSRRQADYTDVEVVEGLQRHDRRMEEWFFRKAGRYFDDHFRDVFFDQDRRQEIFQNTFLKLWMEIDNRRISVCDECVCRRQDDGSYRKMTCQLTTFLMAFARTEYREMVRSLREDPYADVFEHLQQAEQTTAPPGEEDAEETKIRIVDECINQLPPRCAEILTLFYYKGMSLDEILEMRKENTSKNGLKTAKNKCMNTLKERITETYEKYHLSISH